MIRRKISFNSLSLSLVAAVSIAAVLSSASCSPVSRDTNSGGAGGNAQGGAGGSNTGGGGEGGGFIDPGNNTFGDFPTAPVVEDGLAADIANQFTNTPGMDTGGPCLSEPPSDSMVPRNWTPLFFEWNIPADLNVFELRLEVDNQIRPLVVYTTKSSFSIDPIQWKGLTEHSAGHDIKITLRGAKVDNGAITMGPMLGASAVVHIAPVAAPGSVVYWAASGGTSFQGFTIGDTTSKTVLTPQLAGPTSTGGTTSCVSCHASSPDGKFIIYTRDAADANTRAVDARYVTGGVVGPDVISPSALALLGRDRQMAPVFSAAHYSPSDAVAITVLQNISNGRYDLAWTDLHAVDTNGWGLLARNGDPRQVVSSPSWSHDGKTVAYVTSAAGGEGVIADTNANDATMDIYTIPYNNRAGGDAMPMPGASDPAWREFYPVYSPDDTFLAFNRTDQPVSSYNQPSAELAIVPGNGGTAMRLRANDPPACTGLVSPGLTNSWARWAPKAELWEGKKYYWLVFSSKRRVAGGLIPQLYISAVVTQVSGNSETLAAEYPAIYVTAQDPTGSNHTPAWDFFEVEQIPPK